VTALLDAIKAHAKPDQVRTIPVPEWALEPGGAPLVIHYTMVTLDDLAVVTELDGQEWSKRAARIICLKAMDETGKKLFAMGDALVLRSTAAPEVVNRLAMQMLGRTSIEDAAKN
jgi:hypothetical protein